MRLVQLRAPKEEDAACLMRELAVYASKRLRGPSSSRSKSARQRICSLCCRRSKQCIAANDIRTIRVDLDGQKYMLASS
jgi:hypothetical protein